VVKGKTSERIYFIGMVKENTVSRDETPATFFHEQSLQVTVTDDARVCALIDSLPEHVFPKRVISSSLGPEYLQRNLPVLNHLDVLFFSFSFLVYKHTL
jgi:hypothetical protein